MKGRDPVDKKRQKNSLASFFFRHRPYFLCGNSYKPEEQYIVKGIFGAPLECAAQCGTLTPYGLSVPDPVNRCFTEILARGLRVEGLFRLSGAAMEVERLQEQFDQPPTYGKYLDLTKNDIHAVTSLVKKYLRHLPDPVIPLAYHHQFLQLQVDWKHSDRDLVSEWARMIKNEFPTTHYHVLHYIILVVSWIQHYQHLNLMNPEALAVVLAPICSGLEKNILLSSTSDYTNNSSSNSSSKWSSRTAESGLESVDQIIAANLKWTTAWTLLIQHHDILLDHWRPKDLSHHHHHPYHHHHATEINTPTSTLLWQRHSIPSSLTESGVDTPFPWTQSTMTAPEDDTLMVLDDDDEDDDDDDDYDDRITAPQPNDDRYGVIVMRKQHNYRRRHLPGVAKDDEHIYLYDTPLPPLPIPELHPHHGSCGENDLNSKIPKSKKRRFLLRRPKSIASLQPRLKASLF